MCLRCQTARRRCWRPGRGGKGELPDRETIHGRVDDVVHTGDGINGAIGDVAVTLGYVPDQPSFAAPR